MRKSSNLLPSPSSPEPRRGCPARQPTISTTRWLFGIALLLALGGSLTSAATRAWADEPTAGERALARDKFRAGLEAAQEGDWTEAHDAFARSYELYPRSITLLNLSGARLKTGRLLEAAQGYRRFLIEAEEERERSLRETAEGMLTEVEERVPKVRIRALGIEEDDTLALDGDRLSHATVGELLPVNPGTHELTLTRPGFGTIRAEFSIDEREWRTVVLDARPEMWPADRQAVLEEEVETRAGSGRETSMPIFGEDGSLGDGYAGEGIDEGEGGDSGGLLESPWFWLTAGVLLLGGGLVTYLLLSGDSGEQAYMGNLESSIGIR